MQPHKRHAYPTPPPPDRRRDADRRSADRRDRDRRDRDRRGSNRKECGRKEGHLHKAENFK